MNIDLTNRFEKNNTYEAWKFPGGELHFRLKSAYKDTSYLYTPIITTLENSDDLILLCLAVDTIKSYYNNLSIKVFIKYMAYQQADRRFSEYESFSLQTICNILNTLPVDKYIVFDPHSDVTPALLKNCEILDNSFFIESVLSSIDHGFYIKDKVLLSPDAGAYKKIFKLAEKIGFNGNIECANKYRDHNGNLDIRLSCDDFEGKPVVIVDDICVGGRTFIQLAEKLQDKNIGKLYLAVSHGVFSNGITLLQKYFDTIFTTNSRQSDSHAFVDVYNIQL